MSRRFLSTLCVYPSPPMEFSASFRPPHWAIQGRPTQDWATQDCTIQGRPTQDWATQDCTIQGRPTQDWAIQDTAIKDRSIQD